MPVNVWRGDAPSREKIVRILRPTNLIGVRVRIAIGNKYLTFDDWDPAAIVAGFAAAGFAETDDLTFAVSGDDVTVTGQENDDFDIVVTTTPTVEVEFTQGVNPINQQSRLTFPGATGGTFTVTVNGETTSAVTLGDVAGLVTALEALTGIAAGDVAAATSTGGSVVLTWQNNLAAVPVAVSINGAGLNNGGAVTLVQTDAARPASHDVWFLVSQTNLGEKTFSLTRNSVAVGPFYGNISAAELSSRLSVGWGGEVRVRQHWNEKAGVIEANFLILDMVGFPGENHAITVTSVTPSTTPSFVGIERVVDRADTTPSTVFLLDFTDGDIEVSYRGQTATLSASTLGANDDALNDILEFSNWTELTTCTSADLNGGSEAATKMSLLIYNTYTKTGGGDIPVGEFSVTGGDGELILLQRGGSTNAATAAIHQMHVGPVNPANTISAGTFRLAFPEGRTATIAYNASAANVKTALDNALGFATTVTGSGTAAAPWVITFSGDPGNDHPLPTVFEKLLRGDGTATAIVSRESAAGESASAVVRVSRRATSGSYELKSGSEGPVSFPYNANGSAFKALLEDFPSLATTGDTAVSFDSDAGEYTITYQSGLASQIVDALTVYSNSLVTNDAEIASIRIDQTPTGPANFADPQNWSLGRSPDADDEIVIGESPSPIIYGLRQFVAVTADASTDILTAAGGFDFVDGTQVKILTDDTIPAGLSESTTYFVIDADPVLKTFRLSTSEAGAAVNITSAGTGPHYCGVIASDFSVDSRFDQQIGRPARADAGFLEYRSRYLAIGIDADGQADIGKGTGAGSGLIRIDVGTSRALVTVYGSSQSTETGVPAVQIQGFAGLGSLLVSGGEAGVAIGAEEVSKFGAIAIHGGSLELGSVTVVTNLIRTGGDLRSRRASVAGLVSIS